MSPALQINFLAVVVAAVATFALGALWYSPVLLGKHWVVAHGYTSERIEQMRRGAGRAYAISALCFLAMAAAVAVIVSYLDLHRPLQGLKLGLLLWAGFAFPLGLTANAYSDRRLSAFLIDAGYQLVYLLIMGAIIAAWR